MTSLYRSPLRVYLLLAILSLLGILSATKLPISLFPNSTKPQIGVCIAISLSPDAFLRTYGTSIEEQFKSVERNDLQVENVVSTYSNRDACYDIHFKWGGDPQEALREVQTVVNSLKGRLPSDSSDRISVWSGESNGGFLALSFYSSKRDLNDLYSILEPALTPRLARVREAQEAVLFNPQKRQVSIELKPEAMAAFQLLPAQVAQTVLQVFEAYGGGSLTVGTNVLRVEFPRAVSSFEDLKTIQVPTPTGRSVSLGDIAHLDLTIPLDSARTFKTSGSSSVILWASPKPGGNVKSMAEEVHAVIASVMPTLPPDIEYKVLVDPSEFIRSAVHNVAHEVLLAAGLAVLILFLFVGNIRNVATAAIEIPLSIVLAFILMRLSGMNLNLISLGGLALSAGMNVDASVVVMENIFRHFDRVKGRQLNFEERFKVVVGAVQEVQFSVIASTIASLVVFIPLAFTSDLSYAILGDLAKAVVFSHGFSAVVALLLVPTIRLHLMKDTLTHEKPSILEGPLTRLENAYGLWLEKFLIHRRWRWGSYAGLTILFVALMIFVLPRLPREIIGKPDTDWLILGINSSGNTLNRQMEAQTEQIEAELLQKFGDHIRYTFTQIHRANSSMIMFRLKDKKEMEGVWKKVEEAFPNTPFTFFWIDSWNPAELPLPNPPDFKVTVRGSDIGAMAETARDLGNELREKKIFTRVNVEPNASLEEVLRLRPRLEQWPLLAAQGFQVSLGVLSDFTRTATQGRYVTRIGMAGEDMDVYMSFPQNYVATPEELEALPVGMGGRILPLKALATISREEQNPAIRRENGRELFVLSGRVEKGEEKQAEAKAQAATAIVEKWPEFIAQRKEKSRQEGVKTVSTTATSAPAALPTLQVEDAKIELTSALQQLLTAVSLSIGLIFLTMVFQFGSVMNSLLVLVAVPLGFIGVLISLFVFKSTLSLNSMLGVILLNGLAVANSIILVDFLQRAVKSGVAPRLAAVQVGRARLRPILMTSLTTGLGMLPIAFGTGEGGKILQPLGIAVAGGLGFSMITTLFIVPSLQVSWLEWRARKQKSDARSHGGVLGVSLLLTMSMASPSRSQAADENRAAAPSLGASVESTSRALSFLDAYRLILDRNIRIDTQRLTLESSEQQKKARIGAFAPSLALEWSEVRGGEPVVDARQTGALVGRMNLFRSGGDVAALKAADGDLRSQKEKLLSETQGAQEDAVQTLTQVIARTMQKRIIQRILVLKQDSLRVAKERFDRGLLPQQEVEKVRIEVENARARLTDAETTEIEARATLRTLLGSDDIIIEWPLKSLVSEEESLQTRDFSLESRADWRAALAAVDAEKWRKRQSVTSFLPSLDLTASYGNQDLSLPDRRDWSTVLTLSIPIFDSLRSWTNYQTQSLSYEIAQRRAELVRRQASAEVESLRQTFKAARESALSRERTARVTEKLFTDNLQRFRLGRASVNELAIDQDRLLQSQLLEVEGWLQAHLSYVRLCHALGSNQFSGTRCL